MTVTKPPQTMLGLPAERLTQLRALADHHGVSAVEIVERAIRSAIEAGEIEDTLPGFAEIAVVDDDLLFVSIRGESLPPLDRNQATLIATLVDAATGKETSLGADFKVGKGFGVNLDANMKLIVGRHARAVLLALVDARTDKPAFSTATSAGIATDFARLIRKHAAQIMWPVANAVTGEPTDFLKQMVSGEPATATGEARA